MQQLQITLGGRVLRKSMSDEETWDLLQKLDAPLGGTLAEMEAFQIRHALSRTAGNVSEAARQLGLSRRALHYKIKGLGVQ